MSRPKDFVQNYTVCRILVLNIYIIVFNNNIKYGKINVPDIFGVPLPDTLAETMSERLSFWSSVSNSREEATLWLEAASDTASRLSDVLPIDPSNNTN